MPLGGVRQINHRAAADTMLANNQDLNEISNLLKQCDHVSVSSHVTLHVAPSDHRVAYV